MEESQSYKTTRSKSSSWKWIIVILLIVFILFGICSSCIGLVMLGGSADFETSITGNNSGFDISGNEEETIAVIQLDGVIMDAPEAEYDQNIVDYTVSSLDKAKNDKNVQAVILVLNTPGGSTYDTAKIGDKIDEVKAEGKLVVSVMEQVAASGGYWIAAKSDYIITGSETITGSIGALWDIVLYDRLLEKIGVDQLTINNIESPNKTIGDGATRDPQGEKYRILQDLANSSYDEFVGVVLEGRGKTKEELGSLLDGRIIGGRQAVEAGMADEIGYFEDGVEYVKTTLNLKSPNVKTYGREKLSPFNSVFAKLNLITETGTGTESSLRMRIMLLPTFFATDDLKSENN